ncbi:MAG: hypothetical protein RBS56_05345 [Candidatus Gracilibacteria bacterium]|jgi:cytoskeletal protein CcmA (bactofilin family)|nr:hypothetical protein [Candidatus Gracilibacteria bacterium]
MFKIKYLILGILLAGLGFSSSAFAMDIRTGENLFINETIVDDLYLVSGNVTLNADVVGDVYVLGGSVSVNGNISEDMIVIGGKVTVTGNIGDDLRVLGGQVSVYSNVGDDLVIAGGSLDIGPGSVVNGSAYTSGGLVSLDGTINENLSGNLSVLLLNGVVNGNVDITVENSVSFSQGARVGGDFTYRKLIEDNIPKGVVSGRVIYKEFSNAKESTKDFDTLGLFVAMKSFSLVNALLIALLLVLFTPKFLEKSAEVSKVNLLKTFALGLLTLILVVVGAIILLITIVGVHIAIICGFIFGAMLYLAKIFACTLLVSYIVDFKKKKHLRLKLFFGLTLCLIIYYMIGMTPFVGWLLNGILFLTGLGSMVLTKQYYVLYLRNKNQI